MSQFNRFIQADGPRNAVVTLTGILDSGDAAFVPAISLSDFINNDDRFDKLNGFRVDEINYSIGQGIQINLTWAGVSEQLIAAIAGFGKLKFRSSGGLQPIQSAVGYTGDINLRSSGFNTQGVPPQNFTIELYLVKLYKNF